MLSHVLHSRLSLGQRLAEMGGYDSSYTTSGDQREQYARAGDIYARVLRLAAEVDDLDNGTGALAATVLTLYGAMADAELDITALYSDLAILQTSDAYHTLDITALETTVGVHTTAIADNTTTIATHSTDIGVLQSATGAIVTAVTALQTTATAHTSSISDLQLTTTDLQTAVTAIETVNATQTANITALYTSDINFEAAIIAINTVNATYTSDIAALSTATATNTSAIATHTTEILAIQTVNTAQYVDIDALLAAGGGSTDAIINSTDGLTTTPTTVSVATSGLVKLDVGTTGLHVNDVSGDLQLKPRLGAGATGGMKILTVPTSNYPLEIQSKSVLFTPRNPVTTDSNLFIGYDEPNDTVLLNSSQLSLSSTDGGVPRGTVFSTELKTGIKNPTSYLQINHTNNRIEAGVNSLNPLYITQTVLSGGALKTYAFAQSDMNVGTYNAGELVTMEFMYLFIDIVHPIGSLYFLAPLAGANSVAAPPNFNGLITWAPYTDINDVTNPAGQYLKFTTDLVAVANRQRQAASVGAHLHSLHYTTVSDYGQHRHRVSVPGTYNNSLIGGYNTYGVPATTLTEVAAGTVYDGRHTHQIDCDTELNTVAGTRNEVNAVYVYIYYRVA